MVLFQSGVDKDLEKNILYRLNNLLIMEYANLATNANKNLKLKK